jgi:hypothetical protein
MTPPLGILPIFVTYIWRVPNGLHIYCVGLQHNDRFPQGPPSQMGSPMGSRTGTETPQAPLSGVGPVSAGPGGFGRGSQGGNFEGPNKRRRY